MLRDVVDLLGNTEWLHEYRYARGIYDDTSGQEPGYSRRHTRAMPVAMVLAGGRVSIVGDSDS